MYPGQIFRLIFAFILFGASAVVLVTVVKTAITDFHGNCLVDAEVFTSPSCNQECGTGVGTCAGGQGSCGSGQCSVNCYDVSDGSSGQCWYIVAADALSLLIAILLLVFAVIALAIGRPVGYCSSILLLIVGLFMAAAMAAAMALLTRGYVNLCNSLDDAGSSCGNDVNGYYTHNNLPSHYNSALQAALIAGWIATLFWLFLAISSFIQLCLVSRREWQDYEAGPVKRTTAVTGPSTATTTTSSTIARPATMGAATGAGAGALAGALASRPAGQDYRQTAEEYPLTNVPPARPTSYTNPFSAAAAAAPIYSSSAPVYPGPNVSGAYPATASTAAAPATTVDGSNIPVGIPVASAPTAAASAYPAVSSYPASSSSYPASSAASSAYPAASSAYPATTATTADMSNAAPMPGATRVYPAIPGASSSVAGSGNWTDASAAVRQRDSALSQPMFPTSTNAAASSLDNRPYPPPSTL